MVAPFLHPSNRLCTPGRDNFSPTWLCNFWSHGLFAQRLGSAAYRHAGRHVIVDSGEPGTSKTCGDCGHWNADLGGNKTFHCTACGTMINRDLNGARNNFFAAYGAAQDIGWDGIHR